LMLRVLLRFRDLSCKEGYELVIVHLAHDAFRQALSD